MVYIVYRLIGAALVYYYYYQINETLSLEQYCRVLVAPMSLMLKIKKNLRNLEK